MYFQISFILNNNFLICFLVKICVLHFVYIYLYVEKLNAFNKSKRISIKYVGLKKNIYKKNLLQNILYKTELLIKVLIENFMKKQKIKEKNI